MTKNKEQVLDRRKRNELVSEWFSRKWKSKFESEERDWSLIKDDCFSEYDPLTSCWIVASIRLFSFITDVLLEDSNILEVSLQFILDLSQLYDNGELFF